MSDGVWAQVQLSCDSDGLVSLAFGPMSIEDLMEVLTALGTEEGHQSFLIQMNEALKRDMADDRRSV